MTEELQEELQEETTYSFDEKEEREYLRRRLLPATDYDAELFDRCVELRLDARRSTDPVGRRKLMQEATKFEKELRSQSDGSANSI